MFKKLWYFNSSCLYWLYKQAFSSMYSDICSAYIQHIPTRWRRNSQYTVMQSKCVTCIIFCRSRCFLVTDVWCTYLSGTIGRMSQKASYIYICMYVSCRHWIMAAGNEYSVCLALYKALEHKSHGFVSVFHHKFVWFTLNHHWELQHPTLILCWRSYMRINTFTLLYMK